MKPRALSTRVLRRKGSLNVRGLVQRSRAQPILSPEPLSLTACTGSGQHLCGLGILSYLCSSGSVCVCVCIVPLKGFTLSAPQGSWGPGLCGFLTCEKPQEWTVLPASPRLPLGCIPHCPSRAPACVVSSALLFEWVSCSPLQPGSSPPEEVPGPGSGQKGQPVRAKCPQPPHPSAVPAGAPEPLHSP